MRIRQVFKNIALMCFLLFIGQANQLFAQSNTLPYALPSLSPWENPIYTPSSGLYLNTPSVLFEIFPFIFLIGTLFFFMEIIDKEEINIKD